MTMVFEVLRKHVCTGTRSPNVHDQGVVAFVLFVSTSGSSCSRIMAIIADLPWAGLNGVPPLVLVSKIELDTKCNLRIQSDHCCQLVA